MIGPLIEQRDEKNVSTEEQKIVAQTVSHKSSSNDDDDDEIVRVHIGTECAELKSNSKSDNLINLEESIMDVLDRSNNNLIENLAHVIQTDLVQKKGKYKFVIYFISRTRHFITHNWNFNTHGRFSLLYN